MTLDRRIRAAFITPSLYWGGAERWLYDLAKHTDGSVYWTGCAVVGKLYTDDTMLKMVSEIMPVWGHGRKAVQHVGQSADVLIAWGTHGLDRLVEGLDKPVVFVAHGSGMYDRTAIEGSLSGATHFTGVSEACVRAYRGLVDASKVRVVHNGINADRCEITRRRKDVRDELGLKDSDFAVGYLGRLAPEKHPAEIAKAVALLHERFKGVWVGDGWDEANQKAAITRILGNRAIFRSRVEDIGNYLQAFDAFVLLSPAEGFSLAMLEAMYVGVPVVATPVGELPYLEKRHGRHWEQVSLNPKPAEAAAAIRHVAGMERKKLRQRVANARTLVESEYLAEHMAQRWQDYLLEIVSTPR